MKKVPFLMVALTLIGFSASASACERCVVVSERVVGRYEVVERTIYHPRSYLVVRPVPVYHHSRASFICGRCGLAPHFCGCLGGVYRTGEAIVGSALDGGATIVRWGADMVGSTGYHVSNFGHRVGHRLQRIVNY